MLTSMAHGLHNAPELLFEEADAYRKTMWDTGIPVLKRESYSPEVRRAAFKC